MNKKKLLGQFNTTNKEYILDGFGQFLGGKYVVDPFAGDGDLLKWAEPFGISNSIGYDVDQSKPFIHRDTLQNPVDLSGKWVLTNPPYLAQNKSSDKTYYHQYGHDDLYKVALHTFCETQAEGGIVIIPVNFLSGENSRRIRSRFFQQYDIKKCVVFEETVFDDTDYTVCSIYFERSDRTETRTVPVTFKPSGKELVYEIHEQDGWVFGEDYHRLTQGEVSGIGRFTKKNVVGDRLSRVKINDVKEEVVEMGCCPEIVNNILLLRAIDTGTAGGRIKLHDIRDFGIDCLVGKSTSRNWAHIKFQSPPSIERQEEMLVKFNSLMDGLRDKYNSIFLTSFRNSTRLYSRKRISFDAVYKIISRL